MAQLNIDAQESYQYMISAGSKVSDARAIPEYLFRRSHVYLSQIAGSGKELEFGFYQHQPQWDFYQVEEVRVHIHSGGEVEVVKLESSGDNSGIDNQWTVVINTEIVDKLILEVKYRDGEVFKGEVWPDEEYMREVKYRY